MDTDSQEAKVNCLLKLSGNPCLSRKQYYKVQVRSIFLLALHDSIAKERINSVQRMPTGQEKVLTNYVSDRILTSRTQKELKLKI